VAAEREGGGSNAAVWLNERRVAEDATGGRRAARDLVRFSVPPGAAIDLRRAERALVVM
jgi:hypothetical protein